MTPSGFVIVLLGGGLLSIIGYAFARIRASNVNSSEQHALWWAAFWLAPMTMAVIAMLAPILSDLWPSPRAVGSMRGSLVGMPLATGYLTSLILSVVGTGAAWRLARLTLAGVRLRGVIDRSSPYAIQRTGDGPMVRISHEIGTPLLAGLISPVILLPTLQTKRFSAQQLALICAHEDVHARRWDHIQFLLEEIALALLWWSPASCVSRHRLIAAREVTCDRSALAGVSAAGRTLYARTVIEVLRAHGRPHLSPAFCAHKAGTVADRIERILDPGPPARNGVLARSGWSLMLSAVVIALTFGSLAGETISSESPPASYTLEFQRVDHGDATTSLYRLSRGIFRVSAIREPHSGGAAAVAPEPNGRVRRTAAVEFRPDEKGQWIVTMR